MAIAGSVGEWWMPTAETTKQKVPMRNPLQNPCKQHLEIWDDKSTTRSSNAKPRIQRGPKPHATTSETSDSWWMDDVRLFPNLFLSKQSLDKNAICQMSYIKATMPKCPSETSPQVDKHNLKTDSFYASLCCVLLCILFILWTCLAWAKHGKNVLSDRANVMDSSLRTLKPGHGK